jgi:hypothetical protein
MDYPKLMWAGAAEECTVYSPEDEAMHLRGGWRLTQAESAPEPAPAPEPDEPDTKKKGRK